MPAEPVRRPALLTRLAWPDERIRARHRGSTHDLDLGHVLDLASALGKLPSVVTVWGVEMGACHPGGDLSLPVEQALAELEQTIVCELNEPGGEEPERAHATQPRNERWCAYE